MADNQPNSVHKNSEEIDLRELLRLLSRGMQGIGNSVLRTFIFFKKNILKLIGLIIIGVAIGFMLNNLMTKKYKTEVIVKPNFNSKEYLYDVIDEIQAKLIAKDSNFFKDLNIDIDKVSGLSIQISPIENEDKEVDNTKRDTDYLKVLQEYKENDFVIDAVRLEILKKIIFTHRITFTFKNLEKGEEYSKILVDYINSNPYYSDLQKVYKKNSETRIESNSKLIAQIDDLVDKYANQLSDVNSTGNIQTPVILDAEKSLDAPGLLTLKNKLIAEIEENHIRLAELENPISIINFGKARKVEKRFFTNATILAPIILVLGFFLMMFIKFLDKKSNITMS